MVRLDRFEKTTDVVDRQRRGQPLQHRLEIGQQAAVGLELHMPAEWRDPRRHGFEDFQWPAVHRRALKNRMRGRELGQAIQLCVGNRLVRPQRRRARSARSPP